MTVTFYTNLSDNRAVNKKLRKTKDKMPCHVKMPANLLNPTITFLKSDLIYWSRVNYAYLDEFDRYYFTAEPTVEPGGIVSMSLTIDPLMSNATEILGIRCVIERSETVYNKFIRDELAPVRTTRGMRYYKVGELGSGDCYILTCTGGDSQQGKE